MYQAAEQLLGEVHALLAQAKVGSSNQADHLERSADSILFNTAEGIGAFKPKVKIAAYGIARKEANEVRAILRALVLRRDVENAAVQKAYNLAGACVGMLTRAIIAMEARQEE